MYFMVEAKITTLLDVCSLYLRKYLRPRAGEGVSMETRLVYFTQSSKTLIPGEYKLCMYIVTPRAISKNTRNRLKNATNKPRWDSKNSSITHRKVRKGEWKKHTQREKAD